MSRSALSAAHLYAILDREFRAARSPACTECRVPLPYFRRRRDECRRTGTWERRPSVPTVATSPFAEVLAKLWTKYDLQVTPTH
jgi:hypothetical protein